MKLNQILAIEKGTKVASLRSVTDLHKKSQVPALYEGRERTYQPATEDGEQFPPESQKVQLRSKSVAKEVQTCLSELFDITFTKDKANTMASADIVINGKVLVKDVPVTYLLFLEKQLTDLHTVLSKLPVLDGAENWAWDAGQSAYRTEPVQSARTKKTVKPVIMYPATKEHPAQVKEVTEDVVVGTWKQIRYSAALTQERKDTVTDRVTQLLNSVKFAREAANMTDISKQSIASDIFSFVFAGE